MALGGFSDGASYALSVGLANGDLFTHLVAFSPGFTRPPARCESPRVFLSHGIHDDVLPIDRCSRRLAAALREQAVEVRYRQGAVLILREVLDFSAKEVAAALDTTPASINSALQRARKTADERLPAPAP